MIDQETPAYTNWQRERADYLLHYGRQHRRNDLLQKRLDEAMALISRLQASRPVDTRALNGKLRFGTIKRHKKRWIAIIKMDRRSFHRCGFRTDVEAMAWLEATAEAIGFNAYQEEMVARKGGLADKLDEFLKQEKKKAV